ncbi:MAG: TIGR03032 family protein, partial [Planctomycetota bacterium]
CTVHESFNFAPRWRPSFVSRLEPTDRCHLNGLAVDDHGKPRFVTAHGATDSAAGWRENKLDGGILVDIESGQIAAHGLSMPHSPRLRADQLYLLNSGDGGFGILDVGSSTYQELHTFPGFTRGLAFAGQFAFVGLSKVRETAVFGGLPLSERGGDLHCGVGVFDLQSGTTVATLRFESGVDELFAVDVLPNTRRPFVAGPQSEPDEATQEVWVIPEVSATPTRSPSQSVEQLAQLGLSLQKQSRLAEAEEVYRKAIERAPERAALHCDLGNVMQTLGREREAIACYRDAVRCDPAFVPVRQNLGYLELNHGNPEEALEHYSVVMKQRPSPMSRLLDATVLPVVAESREDLLRWRQRYEMEVKKLVRDDVQIDTTRKEVPTAFFLAYHGLNDRDVMADFGSIYKGVEFCEPATGKLKLRSNGKLRIGFLSTNFRRHTIGKLNLGRIRLLDRSRFEVVAITGGQAPDEFTKKIQTASDHSFHLPLDLEVARRQIAEADVDVLLFADVGMNVQTTTLAYSRMAPVQCVTWGHPDTTGSPTMDYFLSGDVLETENGDDHYTESLVRLPLLATYFERPKRSGGPRKRGFFGLREDRRVYLCPQTLFKFHPDFDSALATILNADPEGDLILIEGRHPSWTEKLRKRLRQSIADVDRRVRFLPAQPTDDFLALLETADVILDPFHFGGGNSTYEALAMGTPVITFPGEFLRSRITLALYSKMGFTDLCAASEAEYVRLATELACNEDFARGVRREVALQSQLLFNDPAELRGLEDFLWSFV